MEVENANNGMNAGVTESVTHTQEDSKAPKENGSKNDNEDKKPRRKKRKTSSCDVCRRFKTRCDFDVMYGKCYRCKVLNLECSLTMERQTEINKTQKLGVNALLNNDDSKDLKPMNIDEITMKVRDMDYNYGVLNHKLDLILNMLQKSHNEGRSPSGNDKQGKSVPFTSVYDDIRPSNDGYRIHEPPLKLINDSDARLFPLDALTQKAKMEREQRPSAVARVKFLDFYKKHQELCHQLSKEFLMRSHFWIIPGGIKEIDETYANKHLFITSVFTIIAMSFADNDKYAQQQEELYPLVERLLTNTLTMFEKLTDYDIEAISYCSMFNISRKAKRYRQLKYNSLVSSNFALYSLLNIVDFHRIKERVNAAEFDMKDLYHLRILNSLTACHSEYSISSGQIWEQNSAIKEFNNLVVKFPQANFADDIKVSEINLNVVVNAIFMNFKTYFHRYLYKYSDNSTVQEKQLLLFDELELWSKDWEELLAKDGAGVLLFTYDFYHIMICRSFITDNKDEVSKYPDFSDNVLYTMKEHAFSLLRGFLRLPPSLIKGAPIFTTYELVYACLSLCDYIHLFDQPERQQVLSTCTRVYWHLSTIGEKMNEATDNVGTIIKSIIDTSKQSVSKTQDMATHNNHSSMRDSMASSGSKLQTSPRQHNNTSSDTKSSGMQLPDVDQYNSFEEFFQGFFNNLKPSTQQIFESSKQTK